MAPKIFSERLATSRAPIRSLLQAILPAVSEQEQVQGQALGQLLVQAARRGGFPPADVFRPLPGWRFVESVDLYVYNRWGQVVFRSIVPAIDWDGTSAQGTPVEEGTYYYRIRVNFRVFSGIESVDREGVVGLYR